MNTVDIILKGGILITMNDSYEIIVDGAIAIKGQKIVDLGPTDKILSDYKASQEVDCSGHVIMPGLINAHTHVAMTLLRALADDLRLDVWLMGYIMPVEREFVNEEFCRLGTSLACAEMIRSGVTSFADMYYFESDIAEACVEAGLRAVLGETILKFPAPDANTYEEAFEYTEKFTKKWANHPLITPSIAPHAPYSNTEETLSRAAEFSKDHDVPLMIHIAETRREQDESNHLYGKTVVSWIRDLGILDAKTVIAAHCVHVDEHELRQLKRHNISVAHCPSANLKLASGIAPIAQMLEMGINVAIGTDGPASNNDLDMFEEMRLAALIAKVNPPDPTALPAKTALRMATINGARALGLQDKVGSLEVGKHADIIVVDINPLHNIPRFGFNPDSIYSQLVYAAKSTDVRDVIVDGRFLMQDRELLTVDVKDIYAKASVYAKKVETFLSTREKSVLSKLVTVSVDVERGESFEVQMKAKIDDADIIEELLSHADVSVIKSVHYRQYDTYFLFGEDSNERVRYREDDLIDVRGNTSHIRQRLTYTSGEVEKPFHDAVLLSRSRFIAPANNPLRFYREYFQPNRELTFTKERKRWHILYKGILYYINVDRILEPVLSDSLFIELKSRTWSLRDAESKADAINEMMRILGVEESAVMRQDYLDVMKDHHQ